MSGVSESCQDLLAREPVLRLDLLDRGFRSQSANDGGYVDPSSGNAEVSETGFRDHGNSRNTSMRETSAVARLPHVRDAVVPLDGGTRHVTLLATRCLWKPTNTDAIDEFELSIHAEKLRALETYLSSGRS
jgi:hypothetical protein